MVTSGSPVDARLLNGAFALVLLIFGAFGVRAVFDDDFSIPVEMYGLMTIVLTAVAAVFTGIKIVKNNGKDDDGGA